MLRESCVEALGRFFRKQIAAEADAESLYRDAYRNWVPAAETDVHGWEVYNWGPRM